MEQAPLISIIMPVYNAGVLLHTAVESVLRQSFADFELLLVDDGSTDGSAALAHELAKKDGRIRVLEQPNAGICAARNLGLQHCRGQWFTFCDDDDTMLPHALETLLVLAKSTGADVVRGGYRLLRANAAGTAVELPHPPGQAIIIHKPAGQGYLQFLQQSGPQFVWNAMYCTNRLGHLRFDETCRKGLEDFAFNAAVFQQADSAAYTPQIVYEHLERQGSTSACGNPAAVQVRLQYLPRWVQAEYTAARAWCPPQQLPKVWSARQAEFVTFVMHQLRDGRLPPKAKAAAWRSLQQVDLLGDALREQLGDAVEFVQPAGGLFMWVRLTGARGQLADAGALAKKAIEEGVAFVPGAPFYAQNPDNATFRLSFATADEDKIREGIARLAKALKA